MSEMIERVAKAIYDANKFVKSWEKSPGRHEPCRIKARAAIQSMREPTEAMETAGQNSTAFWEDAYPESVWHAMIDEALWDDAT